MVLIAWLSSMGLFSLVTYILLPLIAIIKVRRKRIIIFYDFSDALLTVIVYIVIGSINFFILFRNNQNLFSIYNNNFFSDMINVVTFFVSILLTFLMLLYGCYMAYAYNKPSISCIFFAFWGRVIVSGMPVFAFLYYLLAKEIIHKIDYLIMLFVGIISAYFIIYVIKICLMTRKFQLSFFGDYLDFNYVLSLGKRFREARNRILYRKRRL